jgi:riboflavin synthase
MFTGLIEEVGRLAARSPAGGLARLQIAAERVLEQTRPGDSIAVNGVCLTVTELLPDGFTADLSQETLRRSTLGSLPVGAPLNLERALRLDQRLGGHLVTGHIDITGAVESVVRRRAGNVELTVRFPARFAHLVVEKGSLAVDGVSLTVARRLPSGRATFAIIPATWEKTICPGYRPGTSVNIEFDIIAKHLEQLSRAYR